jgi:hypothetical protein
MVRVAPSVHQDLAVTGFEVNSFVALAVVLTVVGAGLVVAGRSIRRRAI